jgi:hypothetical protein
METPIKEIVSLERDNNGNLAYTPFMANGRLYRFVKPGHPIGIMKWTEYEKMKVVAGVGKTFSEIVKYLKEHKSLLGSDSSFEKIRVEAILATDSVQKGILEMSKERYNKAFMLCSLFIYRDGTDPYLWDAELATEMIADWEAERISELDLFFFASLLIPGYRQTFKELQEEAERVTAKLLAFTT